MTIELKSENMKSVRLTFHESLSLLCFVRDLMESSSANTILHNLHEYYTIPREVEDSPPLGENMHTQAFNALCNLSDTLVGWTNLEKVTNTQKSVDVNKELIKDLSEIAKYRMLEHQQKLNNLCADATYANSVETIQKIQQSTKNMLDKIELYIILTR